MATIDLKIIADSNQAVQEITKVTEASKTMQRTVQEGEKRQKGLIEDTIDALKKYEIARNKAMSVEGIEKYNKKIAETKQTLKEYETAGVQANEKVEKSGNKLLSSIGRWVIGFATVTTAIKVFNAIMTSTDTTADLLKREMTGLKFAIDELSRSVVQGNWSELGKRLTEARRAGMEYADALDTIGDRERQLQLEETDRQLQMIELAKIYRNTGLTGVEGYKKREAAAREYIRLAEEGELASIEVLQLRVDAELDAARQILGYSEDITDAKKKEVNQQIINNVLSAKTFQENKTQIEEVKRLQSELTTARAGTPVMQYVQDVLVETGRVIDQNKIGELEKQIAALDPTVVKMANDFGEWGAITEPVRIKITNAYDAIGRKQKEVAASTIRANTMAELSGSMLAKEEEKTLDEREKKLDEFIKATIALQDEYDKSQIDKLEGNEKFAAERDYQLKQIAALKTHLESLGTLTEEHYKWIASLEENANIEFLKKSADYDQKAYDEMVKHGDNVRELDRQLQEEALDLITNNEEEKLKLKIKFAEEDIKLLEAVGDVYSQAEIAILKQRITIWNKEIENNKKDTKSVWTLFGFDPETEEGKTAISLAQENISIILGSVTSALDEIFAKRVEDAQRTRELLETQIDDTQAALDAEVELAKLGYANNVDAKRKELEELKKSREKAIKEEEKALKQQQSLEAASQASSLLAATAQIIFQYSKTGPVIGQIMAIAAIAAMWGTFAAARAQAAKVTKLAEGGVGTETGMITGKSHREGGEPFLNHVEVERGEMWGVLSKSAAAKHGKKFSQIVTSFNKDNLVVERQDAPNNYINVDVNQTNSRLDKVEYQLIKLNRHFGGKREVHETADVRIEKIGNKTRIIRK
jgi:hypothetical protein